MTAVQHQLSAPMRIVLAVDGSEHSRAGAALLAALPLTPGSEVAALGVLTPRHTPGRAALLAALDEVQAVLENAGRQAHTGLLHGQPAQALTEFANKHRPDLLVVGARGLRATLGILLGGVAQQVVEHARTPVLVVRAPSGQLRRVLAAVDGSPASDQAVEFLARFPLPAEVTLEAMHVTPPPPPPEFLVAARPAYGRAISPLTAAEIDRAAARQAEAEEEHGRRLLERAAAVLGPRVGQVLARGDAASEIIEHARAHGVDLVVAGSRGLGAVSGWLLGSVSRKLVHYAGCSVLIVPEPEAA